MDPLAAFVEMLGGPLRDEDLARASMLIAAVVGPDVIDVDQQLARFDQLAAGVTDTSLDAVMQHLFRTEGFAGDHEHYYDPANSLLPTVLDRRRGIPITLSIVMIEVGRRAGVPLVGIGLPGHFLVGDQANADRFVDPFSGGVVLDRPACQRLFAHLHGPQAPFLDRYLDPVDTPLILARVLANLKQIAAASGDRRTLVRVLRLRSAIPLVGANDRAELADALVAAGQFDEAASLLDALVEASAPGADAERHHQAAIRARANLN